MITQPIAAHQINETGRGGGANVGREMKELGISFGYLIFGWTPLFNSVNSESVRKCNLDWKT